MRRLVLGAAAGALLFLASLESVSAETIYLSVTGNSHSGVLQASANSMPAFAGLTPSSSGATGGLVGSQGTSVGPYGSYNISATSTTVTGAPNTTVSGVNLTSSAISQIAADRGGNATAMIPNVSGSATATVGQATMPFTGGIYYAEGTLSHIRSTDAYTGGNVICQIVQDGTIMAQISATGTSWTSQVVGGSNSVVSITPGSGQQVPVQFLTRPGATITVRHVLTLGGQVASTGSLVTSQAGLSSLEDIHVEYR